MSSYHTRVTENGLPPYRMPINRHFALQAAHILATRRKEFQEQCQETAAAVLVPIFEKAQVPHLLLTKRSRTLRGHSGEVAFPGGRCDETDASCVNTALREAEEEIGLSPHDVQVLGELDTFRTRTGYCITPVVGIIPYPYNFCLNQAEIEYLIEVPLPVIADPAAQEVHLHERFDRRVPIYFYHYADQDPIWGASGYIVHQFLKVIYPLMNEGNESP